MDRLPPGGAPMSDAVTHWLRAVPAGPHMGSQCVDDGVLMDFQSGRLADDLSAAVDRHLATCADCRTLLRDLAEPVPEALVGTLVGMAPAPTTRRWWPALVAAALAAGVMLMVLPFGARGPVPAYSLHGPYGGAQATRAVQTSTVFGPDSRLKILLRPSADLTVDAPTLRAFVTAPGGALVAVPSAALTEGVGGAWRVQAPAADLFEAPGVYTMHLALATDASALEGLAGRTADEARRAAPLARWMTIDLEYRDE